MGQPRQRAVLAAIDRLYRAGTGAGLSDAQLMERFATRHGEAAEAAFAAIVERHGPMVLRVCRRVLNDSHDAQDAFQATFLILVRQPGAVRRRDSLAGWLHGVALRVSAHSRAASARRRAVEQAAGSRFAPGYVSDEGRHEVWDEVDRLPERYRLAVVLCYLEGLTHEQAADRLGWPVGTVRSRLARARERLRGRLVKRGLAPSGVVLAGLVSHADAKLLPLSLVEHTIKAAMLIAAHDAAEAGLVSASAAALTEGVLRTMFFAKLKTAALALLAAGGVAAGAGVYGYQTPQPFPRPAPVVAVDVADDSATPATAPAVSDDSDDPEPTPRREIPRRLKLPEMIAKLTASAREEQDRGNLAAASAMAHSIAELANRWESDLKRSQETARPLGKMRPSLTLATQAPADETNRRLAEVEQKLERVLRALEDERQPRPALASPTEPGAPKKKVPLFKTKKAPVITYPKREAAEAEVAEPPVPAAPARPPAPPRPPEPPKPPVSPDGEN